MAEAYENPAFQPDSESGNNNLAADVPPSNGKIAVIEAEPVDTPCVDTKAEIGGTNEESPKDASIWTRGRSLLYRRRGLLLATGAALFFSAENMFMDALASTMNVFEISAIMSAFEIILTLLCALITRKDFPTKKLQYFTLLISGLSLAAGLPLSLESLKHISVGDSTTIIYTMPIFSGIFSWIILRERLRVVDFLFALLSLGGVVLIARPPFIFGSEVIEASADGNPFVGALYALGGAINFALLVVVARKQSVLGLHPFTILLFNVIVVLIVNAVICTILAQWRLPDAAEWGYLVGLAFTDIIAQVLIYSAVVVEVAMYVSITSTSEVIFTFLWQFIFLMVAPDWITGIGVVLILASCIGIATKRERNQEEGVPASDGTAEQTKRNTVPTISEEVNRA